MERAIEQTKLMITSQYKFVKPLHFDSNYQYLYLFTNENIDAYLRHNNFKSGERALSVLASGDHVFNLIANGIKDIDTFDINKLTEYYVFGLKLAIIKKSNYIEFFVTYNKLLVASPQEFAIIITDLLPYMDQKYRKYWREVVDFYIRIEKECSFNQNLLELLQIEELYRNKIREFNTYLQSEENYNQFKANLNQSNIRFEYSNAINLPEKFTGKYDYLLLSNILDYIYKYWGEDWGKDKLDDYLNALKCILNPNALIYLHYCFRSNFDSTYPINCSKIKYGEFNNSDILYFNGKYDQLNSMILKRMIEK